MTLATRLPYSHPFAGGYPRLGGQALPTDPDAIDYLQRQAAVDGPVEVGVAMAVDAFVKGCKADSAGYAGDPTRTVWDAIKSSCIMCGARTLAGALVSLKSYGDELWGNPSTLQSIANANGTDGAWDANTQTMSNTTGASIYYPRFRFTLAEPLKAGSSYRIEGRLSGDTTAVFGIRPTGATNYASYTPSTGEFTGTVLNDGGATLEILLVTSASSDISVTIEELSIKEYFANPTNVANNFTGDDYDRTTGLKGDGSTTYLDSNRANNADGQDDNHLAVYSTANPAITNRALAGEYYGPTASGTQISQSGSSVWTRCRTVAADISLSFTTGLLGVSRASASSYTKRAGLQSSVVSTASVAPSSQDLFLFALHESGAASGHSDARLAFYSIGSAIPNLAALDARVTNLVKGIQFWHYTGLSPHAYDPDTIAYVVAGYAAGGTL